MAGLFYDPSVHDYVGKFSKNLLSGALTAFQMSRLAQQGKMEEKELALKKQQIGMQKTEAVLKQLGDPNLPDSIKVTLSPLLQKLLKQLA